MIWAQLLAYATGAVNQELLRRRAQDKKGLGERYGVENNWALLKYYGREAA